MIALGLESILVGHVAQRDEVAIGIAVAVGARLDQDQFLMLLHHLAIGGLRPGHNDLLQVANVLNAYSVGGLVAKGMK